MIISNSFPTTLIVPCTGFTSLREAVIAGNAEAVELSIERGEDPFQQDPVTGDNAFHLAASQADGRVITKLLQCHITPGFLELRNALGETALYIAARSNAVEVFRALLKSGAQLFSRTKKMWTPLHVAAEEGHVAIIEQYRGRPVDVKAGHGPTPLFLACKAGKAQACRLLIELGANPAGWTKGWNPLLVAAYYGFESIISLYEGSDVEAFPDITALYLASQQGHLGAACHLLLLGANPMRRCTNKRLSSLHVAVLKGRDDIVELFKHNSELREQRTGDEETPLYLACKRGHARIVRQLLDAGSDPAVICKRHLQETPLHVAADENFVEVVREFKGCSKEVLEAVDPDGYTPFMLACSQGSFDAARELALMGAKIDQVTADNWTALSMAALNGHTEIISLFSDRVDLFDRPLHIAANADQPEFVAELLERGASIRSLPLLYLSYSRRVIEVFIAHMQKKLKALIQLTSERDCYEEVMDAFVDVLFLQARFSRTLKLDGDSLNRLMQQSSKVPLEAFHRAYQMLPVYHNRDVSILDFEQECQQLKEYIGSTQLKRLEQLASDKVSSIVTKLTWLLLTFSPPYAVTLYIHSIRLKKALENDEALKPILDAFHALNYLIFNKFNEPLEGPPSIDAPAPLLMLSDDEFLKTSAVDILMKRYGLHRSEFSNRELFESGLLTGSDLRLIGIDNGFYASTRAELKSAVAARIAKLEYWLQNQPRYQDNIKYQIDCLKKFQGSLTDEGTLEELEMHLASLSLTEPKHKLAALDRHSALILFDLFLKTKAADANIVLNITQCHSLSECVFKTDVTFLIDMGIVYDRKSL
ncbi:MAG: ankyrin repeat domain-containing protein [Verrucomicrobia bacterium]|nr:ankyrin repeat domain-containing protein [Verrucomicrobiota bacterium]